MSIQSPEEEKKGIPEMKMGYLRDHVSNFQDKREDVIFAVKPIGGDKALTVDARGESLFWDELWKQLGLSGKDDNSLLSVIAHLGPENSTMVAKSQIRVAKNNDGFKTLEYTIIDKEGEEVRLANPSRIVTGEEGKVGVSYQDLNNFHKLLTKRD